MFDAVFVLAIAISVFILSYNHTYVDLTPDYSGINSKEIRIGTLLFALPDYFSDGPLEGLTFTIVYPGYSIRLSERMNSYISRNDITIENDRCKPNFPKVLPPNREEDIELSQLTQHRAVMFWPQGEYEQLNGDYAVALFLNEGCIIFSSVGLLDAENHEARKFIFRQMIKDFLKYYSFTKSNGNSEEGFWTLFGNIRKNNKFHIAGNFHFRPGSHVPSHKRLLFIVKLYNSERDYPYESVSGFSLSQRLIYYTQSRLYNRGIMDYRWTLKAKDVHFSSSFYGKEFTYMSVSRNWKSEFNIRTYARIRSTPERVGFFNNVDFEIFVSGSDHLDYSYYNTIYGAWEIVKNSLSVI
jgi:hypothetical protein